MASYAGQRDLLVKVHGVNICGRIGSRTQDRKSTQIERGRHHKAFAGVCVFADEVDATRRLIRDALGAKTLVVGF